MKTTAVIAWLWVGFITIRSIVSNISLLTQLNSTADWLARGSDLIWAVVLPVFGIVAALIVSKQPRNAIGWLLLLPASIAVINTEPYMRSFTVLPAHPPFWFFFSIWIYLTGWLLLIFPVFFIALLFPTGHPLSPRWRRVIFFGLGMCAIFVIFATFQQTFSTADIGIGKDWTVTNPIGFISPNGTFMDAFSAVWGLGMLTLAILSVVSLIVRYRRAAAIERNQIKWLLYACALFAISYMVSFVLNSPNPTILQAAVKLAWHLCMIGIPISIGIAILRHRLYDIDLIIRRTLQYGLLSLLLGLVYFGLVVLLAGAFRALTGQESPLAVVLSTLIIVVLFTPLRRRIQTTIDRRFYRQKYDTARTLSEFSAVARQEVDLEVLNHRLVMAVSETLQPESLSLWLKKEERGQ